MFLSPSHVMVLLESYKYLLIFPIMVVEGPIITVISGFLVYLGFLNGYVAYILLVLGDLTGDILHYFIGKYWNKLSFLKRIGKFLGYNEYREKVTEEHFVRHTGKTLLVAKVSHGVGGFVQIAAGMAKVDFYEFVWWCFLGTIPKTLILFIVGFYLGSSYEKIDTYFDRVALFTCLFVAFGILYIVGRKIVKNFLSKKQSDII